METFCAATCRERGRSHGRTITPCALWRCVYRQALRRVDGAPSRRVRSSSKMGLCACGRGSSVSSPGPRPLLERRHAQMKRPMPMVSQTEIARVSVRLVTHAFREGLRDWLADPGLARDQDKDARRAWPAPYRRKRSSIPCRQQPAWSSHAAPQTGSPCRPRLALATRVDSRISDVSPRDLKNCCSPARSEATLPRGRSISIGASVLGNPLVVPRQPK